MAPTQPLSVMRVFVAKYSAPSAEVQAKEEVKEEEDVEMKEEFGILGPLLASCNAVPWCICGFSQN